MLTIDCGRFMLFVFTTIIICFLQRTESRGRLVDPPARATMWRFGFDTPVNYNDNGLNCGGASNQWTTNGGKCGVCGDPYNAQRSNEAGGKYALGIIARNYTQGQEIRVQVEITANELGWFEFQLCAHNAPTLPVSEQCLHNTTLELVAGGYRYQVPDDVNGVISVDIRLPADVTCSQCVFRWKWNAGNQWGRDSDGKSCVGCGNQEQFYNCADISILPSYPAGYTGSFPASETTPTTTPTTTTTSTTTTVSTWTTSMTTSISTTPSTTTTSTTTASTTASPVVATTRTRSPFPTTAQSYTSTQKEETYKCVAVNNWAGVPSLDQWCELNCKHYNYCPALYCHCQ